MEINKKNIQKGIGALLLVTSLTIGGIGITFHNGDKQVEATPKESEEILNEIERQSSLEALESTLALCVDALEFYAYVGVDSEKPNFIVPEYIEVNGAIGAKIPAGYSLYHVSGEPTGLITVNQDGENTIYYGSEGTTMEGYIGVRENICRVLRIYDSIIEKYNNGTLDYSVYKLPEETIGENGEKVLKIPEGYRLLNLSERASADGVSGTLFEGGYRLYTGSVDGNFDGYLVVSERDFIVLQWARDMKAEVKTYCAIKLGTKTFSHREIDMSDKPYCEKEIGTKTFN